MKFNIINNLRAKKWVLLSALLILHSILYGYAMAWDPPQAHRVLTDAATKNFILNNSERLRESPWLHNGVSEIVAGKSIIDWIIDGSIYEDNYLRFFHHFHDPTYSIVDWGLAGFYGYGMSSALWVQTFNQTKYGEEDWNWFKARQELFNSLWAIDLKEREKHFANVLMTLGHQMHLIQDMAVPAHTINDAHIWPWNRPSYAMFENWA